MLTKTKTKGITNTKLAVASLVALAAGGVAFAFLPVPQQNRQQPLGETAKIIGSTGITVQSCLDQPPSEGTRIVTTKGERITYRSSCRAVGDAGKKRFYNYRCKTNTEMITDIYDFCCKDSDGGANPNVKGVVSGPFSRTMAEDGCTVDRNFLNEGICVNGERADYQVFPANGQCVNGIIDPNAVPYVEVPSSTPSSTVSTVIMSRGNNIGNEPFCIIGGDFSLADFNFSVLGANNKDSVNLDEVIVQIISSSTSHYSFSSTPDYNTNFYTYIDNQLVNTQFVNLRHNAQGLTLTVPINREIFAGNSKSIRFGIDLTPYSMFSGSLSLRMINYTWRDLVTGHSVVGGANMPIYARTCIFENAPRAVTLSASLSPMSPAGVFVPSNDTILGIFNFRVQNAPNREANLKIIRLRFLSNLQGNVREFNSTTIGVYENNRIIYTAPVELRRSGTSTIVTIPIDRIISENINGGEYDVRINTGVLGLINGSRLSVDLISYDWTDPITGEWLTFAEFPDMPIRGRTRTF